MTPERFDAACMSLSAKVHGFAQAALIRNGYVGFTAREDAPGTFHDLLQTHQTRPYGDKFPVYAGGSDQTIYDSPEANYAFRAWHDMLHIELNAPFSRLGEMACTIAQCTEPSLTDDERRILWVDIMGQFEYEQQHGHFPINQREFVRKVLVQ